MIFRLRVKLARMIFGAKRWDAFRYAAASYLTEQFGGTTREALETLDSYAESLAEKPKSVLAFVKSEVSEYLA